MLDAKSEPSITAFMSFEINALVSKSRKKSCSWLIVIHRLAIFVVFIKLVSTTIPVIVITIDVVVLLKTMEVSDVVCELWEVVVFEISHIPNVRKYSENQVSQAELFVSMHFFQFLTAQLVIISLISFWIGLDTPLTAEFM